MANEVEASIKRVPLGARSLLCMRKCMEDRDVDPHILADAPSLLWYALLTPPGREFVAQRILRRYGLRTFIPVRREWRRKNKFVKIKDQFTYAAVPRYVMAGFMRSVPLWFDLFNLPVVSGVVGRQGEPMLIPAKAVASLIRRTGGGLNAPAVQRYMRTHHEFTVGQTVEVIDGPFEGRKVPVVEIRGHCAVVLFEMFNIEQEIEIDMEILQAAA